MQYWKFYYWKYEEKINNTVSVTTISNITLMTQWFYEHRLFSFTVWICNYSPSWPWRVTLCYDMFSVCFLHINWKPHVFYVVIRWRSLHEWITTSFAGDGGRGSCRPPLPWFIHLSPHLFHVSVKPQSTTDSWFRILPPVYSQGPRSLVNASLPPCIVFQFSLESMLRF